jgi:hypothetical protein
MIIGIHLSASEFPSHITHDGANFLRSNYLVNRMWRLLELNFQSIQFCIKAHARVVGQPLFVRSAIANQPCKVATSVVAHRRERITTEHSISGASVHVTNGGLPTYSIRCLLFIL